MSGEGEPPQPSGILAYADVLACAALPLLLVCAIQLAEGSVLLRTLLGAPLLVFVPGYLLSTALWPAAGRDGHETAWLTALAYAFGLNIVLLVPLLMLLAWLGQMTLGNLVVALVVLTAALSVLAAIRRPAQPSPGPLPSLRDLRSDRSSLAALSAIAAMALVTAGTIGYIVSTQPADGYYTDMYIGGADGSAGSLPGTVYTGSVATVRVTVECHEASATAYRLLAFVANSTANASAPEGQPATLEDWAATQALDWGYSSEIDLSIAPGGSWRGDFSFTFGSPARFMLVFILTEAGGSQASYRNHLWVTVE